MNPILKRFLKGLGAPALAFAVKFGLDNIGLILPNEALIPIATALLLALEKSIPNNL